MLSIGVENSFHFPLMTKIIVGKYWKKMNQQQKIELKSSFHRMSVTILATLFDDYNGEKFIYEKTKNGPSKTKLIFTHLLKPNLEKVSIIYVTHKFSGGWRIIDVIVDGGISELKVRQSEYHRTLKINGVSGLIKLLNDNANRMIVNK